jgi:enoyl-CoA hydratase
MVAAVEGGAVAGGFELVLACDLVVAGRSARFGVPEVKRGLVAAGGGALLLGSRVPRALALEMLLTGDPVSAERAAAMGLVNRVVDDGGALEAAVGLATAIAANGPLAVAATKRVVQQAPAWSPAESWARQDEIVAPVFTSADAREGAAAFAERRAPVWKAR